MSTPAGVAMAKSRFEPISPSRRGEALLDAIDDQLATMPPAIAPPARVEHTQAEAKLIAAAKPEAFVVRLAPDVFRQIDAAACAEGVRMTVIIARALQSAGFIIPPDDLKDRRKRRHRGN